MLCAVAASGSLRRAASVLGVSQPGLTAQLQRIERALGGDLFVRHQNGVTPTPLGEIVLARARAVLPTVDDLLQVATLAAGRGVDRHRFRLGSVNTPLLGGLVTAIHSLFPCSEITLRAQGSSLPLADHIAAGRLEAGVLGDCPAYELEPRHGVVYHPVVTEPVFVMLPAAHRLADRAEITLADLADDDWVLPQPDDDRIREYWSLTAGFHIRVPYEAEGRLVVEVVRSGHAVSLCQPTFDEVPGIVVRPIAGTPLWYRHVLAWHRFGPLAARGEALTCLVAQAYEAAVARSRVYSRWRECQGFGADLTAAGPEVPGHVLPDLD
ncbi:LysR family transcriptional regulator [Longispora fulva]|nr:LysR family transcriptional regulator [Longispora fulva]